MAATPAAIVLQLLAIPEDALADAVSRAKAARREIWERFSIAGDFETNDRLHDLLDEITAPTRLLTAAAGHDPQQQEEAERND